MFHHVLFEVYTENMAMDSAERAVQNLLLRSRITADAWIQDKDRLLKNISLAVDTQDGQGVILRSFLSKHNVQVDIRPPDDVSP